MISTVSFAITDANGEKPWGIDSQHLRNLKVVGKNDSLVFAADVGGQQPPLPPQRLGPRPSL